MHITKEQVFKAYQHLKEQIDHASSVLDQALETHLNSMLDKADNHPNYEGTYADQLHKLRVELDQMNQTATNYYTELEGYGIGVEGIGAEDETTEQLLERMKHKGDVIAMLSALHNEIAESSQKVGVLFQRATELSEKVNKSKADASLEELKRKMGLK